MHEDETVSALARALAHPVRLRILRLLGAQSECRGSEIFADLPLAQSTVSEHIRILKGAGLVASHTVGTGAVYCISNEALGPLREFLDALSQTTSSCAAESEVSHG